MTAAQRLQVILEEEKEQIAGQEALAEKFYAKLEVFDRQIEGIKARYDRPSQWLKDAGLKKLVQEREALREKGY